MTNKPKVKRYDDMGCPEQICRVDTMHESDDGDYVLYEDYESLQAENDRLKRYYRNGIECFANPCERHSGERTPPFAEFFEKYGGQCLICVVDNNEALQAELEQWKNGSTIRDEQNEELHQYVLELKTEIEKLLKDVTALVDALQGLLNIVSDSSGVAGYHLNGNIADWDEFEEVENAEVVLSAHRKQGEKP